MFINTSSYHTIINISIDFPLDLLHVMDILVGKNAFYSVL